MQGTHHIKSHVNLKRESAWFKAKLVSQFLTLSFLLTQPFYLSYLHAAPTGGEVVGGTGSISQSDLTTTINQTTQNLAIEWQSFDVNVDERVQFIQPDSSSIALNRIVGNNGSVIQGQIDANGQVFLVNPNGILFTNTATVNVAGLVASGLDISTSDFMNGSYIFNEVIGTDGAVINSGVINAATGGLTTDGLTKGGNVALIGKQVKNKGLISARLGSTALVAGKKVIMSFDEQGLIGVRVSKEVLQEEVGVDEAVINSGEINASGGRVLLTASVSRDVFSQVVNNDSIREATSVVVHEDGSFTLGRGADVLNSGSIDVSSDSNVNNMAEVVLLGENVTSSGSIKADVQNGIAGEIELHANNKTLLTENSITSAQALDSGSGGLIKVLGDKVGLFDEAQVNASGANAGGEVLIGGDRQGLNTSIRNANFIFLGENSRVYADATLSGNGGKIITFAKDTARIHGDLFARGGMNSGDGGFIETSGLQGFELTNAPNVAAINGNGGLWLIDPYSITIVNNAVCGTLCTLSSPFTSTATASQIDVDDIETALRTGDVVITTGDGGVSTDGDIEFQANLDFVINGPNPNSLTLNANRDIIFSSASSISTATGDSLNLILNAGRDVSLSSDDTGINTNGGNFTVSSANTFNSSGATINVEAGNINLDGVTGAVTLGNITETGGGNDFLIQNATSITQAKDTKIDVRDTGLFGNAATTTINLVSTLNTNTNDFDSVRLRGVSATINDANGINLINGTTLTSLLDITAGGAITDSGTVTVSNGTPSTIGTAVANFNTTGDVILNDNNGNFDRVNIQNAVTVILFDDRAGIAFAANDGDNKGGITGNLTLTADSGGDITSYGEINSGLTGFNFSKFKVDSGRSIELSNNANNTFNGRVEFSSASGSINNISIVDNTALNLETIGISGNLNVTASTITQDSTQVEVEGNTTLSSSGKITLIDSNNDFSTVTITKGGVVSLRDKNAISLQSIKTSGDFSVQAGDDISLTDNISTNNNTTAKAGNVIFDGDVVLAPASGDGGTITINTNHASLDDGYITFQNNINNSNGNSSRNNLSLVSGDGDIDIIGSIGNVSNRSIGSLAINSDFTSSTAVVKLRSVKLHGESGGGNSLDVTAGTIHLYNDINTNDGSTGDANGVQLNGNVILEADIDIDTSDSSSDGAVTITGTVNSDSTNRRLYIVTDTGAVDLKGAVGGINATTALERLRINFDGVNTGGTVNLASVLTEGGNDSFFVRGTTINLSGNLTSNADGNGGNITLTGGNVILNDSVSINSSGSGTGNVVVTGDINGNNAVTTDTLTITSGSGAVSLNGDIGVSGEAIEGLNIISSGTSSIRNINTGSGGVIINSDTLTINGTANENTIDTTDNSTAAGVVTLKQNSLDMQANITINTNSDSGTDGDITIKDSYPFTTNANKKSLSLNAGNASVNINTQLTNLAAFSVLNSLDTTLSGIETNDGQITVNAFNDILLGGSYDSGTADMSFNADSSTTDTNNGGLILGSSSDFSGQNISFSGYELSANPISVSAVNTVAFNSTTSFLNVGDPNTSASFELSNTFLSSVSGANTIQLSSSNGSVVFNNADLLGISSELDVIAPTIYFSTADSQFNNINATATDTIHLNRGVTASGNITLNAPEINSDDLEINTAGSTTVESTSGFINIINGASGTAEIIGPDDLNINANEIYHGNILTSRNINIVSGGTYTQTGNIQSTNGNISIIATTGNIGLASNTTNSGSITVTANNGRIFDNNGDAVNITSSGTVSLYATGGIGSGDPLELVMDGANAWLTAINSGAGDIEFINTGSFRIENIINNDSDGTFYLKNNGTVLVNSVEIDRDNALSIATFDVTGGDVLGVYDEKKGDPVRTAPHLTANSAIFEMNNTGSVGQLGAPLITNVPTRIDALNLNRSPYVRYYGATSPKFSGNNAYKNKALQAIESLSGQQLIQVESLAEIDPAIFTDVKNYNHSDIALMMPSDQRYTDDEEEDEEAKNKRQKFINSNH